MIPILEEAFRPQQSCVIDYAVNYDENTKPTSHMKEVIKELAQEQPAPTM